MSELSVSKSELVHQLIQAIMRETHFDNDQLMYLGMRDNQHWYLIGGEHEVSADQIQEMENLEDTND